MDDFGGLLCKEAAVIAAQAGVADQVKFVIRPCRGRGEARWAGRGRYQVVLDPELGQAPPEVTRFVIAHELGHVSEGHAWGDARAIGWWLVGSTAMLAGAFPILAAGPNGAASLQGVLYSWVGMAAFFVCLARSHSRRRGNEYAADAAAAALGYPLTEEALAWFEANEPRALPGYARALSTHPSWPRRFAAARDC